MLKNERTFSASSVSFLLADFYCSHLYFFSIVIERKEIKQLFSYRTFFSPPKLNI